VAVVTGGAKGIGAAIARRLAAEGARVEVWDLVASTDFPGEIVDVAEEAAVERGCAATLARCGRIDILVNNAGILGPAQPAERTSLELWRRIHAVNLDGTFLCCRAVIPAMRRQGGGRIVNIASIAGKEGTPNAAAYSSSKAGVIALTKALGKELVEAGILVNCIAPAAIATDLLAQAGPDQAAVFVQRCPMKRLGTVEEVAALVAWLVSPECSFSTGAVFDLSGGRATY
jgi:3-oxoacyl-[acyl-carrier protein] reductase